MSVDLLDVLLTEDRDVGLNDVEQLCDDGQDPREVPRPRRTVPSRGEGCRHHRDRATAAKNLVRLRGEKKIHAARFGETGIAIAIARIAREIFVRSELEWIHEQAHHDDLRALASAVDQREMPFVQRAHGRDERDSLPVAPWLVERDTQRLNALYDLHGDIRGLEAVIVVGIAARAHFVAEVRDGLTDLAGHRRIALEKFRAEAFVEPEQVVQHEHLPATLLRRHRCRSSAP